LLKHEVAANRQATSIDELASRAARGVLRLTPNEARKKAGMLSDKFWLRPVLQELWPPT
jgi:hypothetical protein